jgi:hypothetical protein
MHAGPTPFHSSISARTVVRERSSVLRACTRSPSSRIENGATDTSPFIGGPRRLAVLRVSAPSRGFTSALPGPSRSVLPRNLSRLTRRGARLVGAVEAPCSLALSR